MNLPTIIEQSGQRVLTTAQLAEAYGTDEKIIRQNFGNNKEHYTEGKHFYCLKGDELKNFFADVNFTPTKKLSKIRKLYLWTERGALLHAKSLNTDKAWEVYDYLIEHYFRAPETYIEAKPIDMEKIEQLHALYQLNMLRAERANQETKLAITQMREINHVIKHPELMAHADYLLEVKS